MAHVPAVAEDGATAVEMEASEVMLVLEGIDLVGATRRARWVPRARLDPTVRP